MNSKLFWTEDFKIRAYEAGINGRVSIQAITNFLLESASNHAAHMDVSVKQLFELNLTWVLSRFHVRMKAYPYWPEIIRVETWPAVKDSFYAIRDFRLLDAKGKEIGVASSSWMMIDFKKRKPVALPEFVDDLENKEAGRTLDDSFERLPVVKSPENEKQFFVRLGDLDVNRHVYSVHYVSWCLETAPPEIWKDYLLTDIEINFRAESVYGDRIISQNQIHKTDEKLDIIHQLRREQDGKELTRMRSKWQLK